MAEVDAGYEALSLAGDAMRGVGPFKGMTPSAAALHLAFMSVALVGAGDKAASKVVGAAASIVMARLAEREEER